MSADPAATIASLRAQRDAVEARMERAPIDSTAFIRLDAERERLCEAIRATAEQGATIVSDPNHRLATGPRPRFIGMTLHAIALSDEGRGLLQFARHGGGDFSAEDRVAIREFLQARRKSPPPPAESAPKPPPRPRQPSVGTKRRP